MIRPGFVRPVSVHDAENPRMARRKLFGGTSTPPQPERYRMPLAFVDGPRHPAPQRRDLAAMEAVASVALEQEPPSIELLAAAQPSLISGAERPLDVRGMLSGRPVPEESAHPAPAARTAILGLSSRLGSVSCAGARRGEG